MAHDKPGYKSEAISEYLAAHPDSSPARIVEGLKEQGTVVSLGLAKVVKYGKGKKKKPAQKKSGQAMAVRTTAEPAVSGSESIRRFIARNPNAKPKAIGEGLKAQGIIVKMGLINAVKYAKGKRPGRKKVGTRTPVTQIAAAINSTLALSFEQLIEVKRFADSIGGVIPLRQALEMLDQLR